MQKDRTRTRSLVEFVCRELERRIINGELPPGTRLEESSVARELGVSRTPVREAIRQLAAARLVEHSPNRSAVVARPGREELVSLFESAAELEALCARFAAARMRGLDRIELQRLAEACEAAADRSDMLAYAEANERMHEFIWQAAGNNTLRELMGMIRARTAPFRLQQFRHADRVQASLAEHRAIVEALIAGDAEAAAEAMRMHLTHAGRKVLQFVFPG